MEKMKRTGKESAEVVEKTITEIWNECGNDEAKLNRSKIREVALRNGVSYEHINNVGNFDIILRPREEFGK